MYSSGGFSFLGRPRFAIRLLYQQKWVGCNNYIDKPQLWVYSNGISKLSIRKRTQLITVLVEGCSINAISGMTGVAKNTVLDLRAVRSFPPTFRDIAGILGRMVVKFQPDFVADGPPTRQRTGSRPIARVTLRVENLSTS